MKASLAVTALRNAIINRNPPPGCIVHSDRGSQFRSKAHVRTLKSNQLRGSMGRVGACGNTTAMESFFALRQKNVLNRQRWRTREELRLAIVIWTEGTYNRRRRQRRLGKLPRSSSRHFSEPHMRIDQQHTRVSTKAWAVPSEPH